MYTHQEHQRKQTFPYESSFFVCNWKANENKRFLMRALSPESQRKRLLPHETICPWYVFGSINGLHQNWDNLFLVANHVLSPIHARAVEVLQTQRKQHIVPAIRCDERLPTSRGNNQLKPANIWRIELGEIIILLATIYILTKVLTHDSPNDAPNAGYFMKRSEHLA